MTTHPVAEIRMTCDTGEPPPMREMRRLLRKVVRGIGSEIMPSGLNCLVRQNRVEAELVLTESVAETSDGPFREG